VIITVEIDDAEGLLRHPPDLEIELGLVGRKGVELDGIGKVL